jgi:acetylornithine/succinyldiaminopimelate/putrescine aminotransferase
MVNSAAQAPLITVRRGAGLLLALAFFSALAGGCSSSLTGREAYFAARSAGVMYQPGTGASRLSLAPPSVFGDNDLALAARNGPVTDVTRWTDAGLER